MGVQTCRRERPPNGPCRRHGTPGAATRRVHRGSSTVKRGETGWRTMFDPMLVIMKRLRRCIRSTANSLTNLTKFASQEYIVGPNLGDADCFETKDHTGENRGRTTRPPCAPRRRRREFPRPAPQRPKGRGKECVGDRRARRNHSTCSRRNTHRYPSRRSESRSTIWRRTCVIVRCRWLGS